MPEKDTFGKGNVNQDTEERRNVGGEQGEGSGLGEGGMQGSQGDTSEGLGGQGQGQGSHGGSQGQQGAQQKGQQQQDNERP
jgi:hypothetical protein